MDDGHQLDVYVPGIASAWYRESPDRMWRSVDGSLVFVDVSGFTALSERLARRGRVGAEELTAVLDRVFSEMLDAAAARGGSLLKFGGDALLLLFDGGDHAMEACASAVEMRSAVREASSVPTSVGRIDLKVSAGVHSGTIDLFLVGRAHRELLVTGPGATVTTRMEATADAGEIVVSSATGEMLPPGHVGQAKGEGWLLRRTKFGAVVGEGIFGARFSNGEIGELIPSSLRSRLTEGSVEAEHRIASVGFVDFHGVDDMIAIGGGDATADALHGLVTTIQDAADEEEVTFLATDVAGDGGKVILATGVPTSLHDDEGRLLRAMRRILDGNSPFEVRAGVNRGHVFVGSVGSTNRRTYTIMGDTVNLAARVMATTKPGLLYATREILDLSSSVFRTDTIAPFAVKGKSKPVTAYAVHEETGVRPPSLITGLPFRGRESELQMLVTIITTCATLGRGSMMTVTGETGIGKSRLIAEVLGRCPDLATLMIQAEPNGTDNPYWALRDPMRDMLGIARDSQVVMERQLRQAITTRAPELLAVMPLLGDVMQIDVPDTAETIEIDPRFRQERVADAVIGLLTTIYTGAFAVVAEDGHWLDEASIGLLQRIGVGAESRPWTVIVTARPEAADFSALGDELVLQPLADDAMRAIVIEATRGAPLRPHELDAVVARAGGNPLFLSEILRVMRDGGDVSALPESLDAVVSIEIDTLPPLAKQLLRYASVLGRAFRRVVLDEFLAPERVDLDEATIRELDRFIFDEGGGRLQFRHVVVHDVAYEGLSYRKRRELHGRAGEVIERLAGDDPESVAEYLAGHYSLAGAHEKVWRFACVAGDKAKRSYSNVEAAAHYRSALDAAGHFEGLLDREVAAILVRLGEVSDLIGQLEQARDAFSRAIRLVADDAVESADLHLLKARTWLLSGEMAQARRNLTIGRKGLDPEGSLEQRRAFARLEAYDAHVLAAKGDPFAAMKAAGAAAAMAAASGEEEALARAYGIIDWANFVTGGDEPRHGQEAIEIFERLGQIDRSVGVKNNMGAFAFLAGRWDEAVDWYRQAVETAERSGNVVEAARTRANIAEVLVEQHKYTEAIPYLDEAQRVYRSSNAPQGLPFTRMVAARAVAALGDEEAALEELEALFADQMASGDTGEDPQIVIHLALLLVSTGMPDQALERMARFAEASPEDAAAVSAGMKRVRGLAQAALGDMEAAVNSIEAAWRQALEDENLLEELLALNAMTEAPSSFELVDAARAERLEELREQLGIIAPQLV